VQHDQALSGTCLVKVETTIREELWTKQLLDSLTIGADFCRNSFWQQRQRLNGYDGLISFAL